MTVANAYTPQRNAGNGVTLAFAVPFPFQAAADLVVQLVNASTGAVTTPVLNGAGTYDFSVTATADSRTGEYPNGTVTFNTAPPGGTNVVIYRNRSKTQPNVFSAFGPLPGPAIEQTADNLEMQAQELGEQLGRALTAPITDTPVSMALPAAMTRLGQVLSFDPVTGAPTVSDPMVNQAVAAAAAAVGAAQLVGGAAALWSRPVKATQTTPPGAPTAGDRYLVAHSGTTGVFAGHEDNAAEWNGVAWIFSGAPTAGQRLFHQAADMMLAWNGLAKWDRAQTFIMAADYGVVGDGVTADDNAADAADAAAGAIGASVDYGSKVVKLTRAHTFTGGFRFDDVSFGSAGNAGFLVTGTGYTAITIGGFIPMARGTVYGSGNACNGILVNNAQQCNDWRVRVYNLAGSGIEFRKCWDNWFAHTSVELCGTASLYAFSVTDGGDTSNESHWGHIQVEASTKFAISISPNTLACAFDVIHSEGAVPVANSDTWLLGGNSCSYNNVRLASTVGANSTLHINAANTTFTCLRCEDSSTVLWEGFGGSAISLIQPDILGTLRPVTNQVGYLTVIGGTVNAITGQANFQKYFGTNIGTITIGFTVNKSDAEFNGCTIGNLASGDSSSVAIFNGCAFTGLTAGLANNYLYGCEIQGASAINLGGTWNFFGGTIAPPTTFTNATLGAYGCRFLNSFTWSGTKNYFFDAGVTIAGAVTGFGVPANSFGATGFFCKNMTPATGQPIGWMFYGGAWNACPGTLP